MHARNTTALCTLLAATFAVGAETALAEMPAAIVAPDATPIVTLHAEGAQIYECKTADDGKLAWAFREPIAALILDGKTVGRHYTGPIWEHVDGSSVHGKAVANAPGATGNDIPWLKLEVIGRRGTGALANADFVQRINTSGGVVRGPCEQAGALRSAPTPPTTFSCTKADKARSGAALFLRRRWRSAALRPICWLCQTGRRTSERSRWLSC
jgi:hypothetical protein